MIIAGLLGAGVGIVSYIVLKRQRIQFGAEYESIFSSVRKSVTGIGLSAILAIGDLRQTVLHAVNSKSGADRVPIACTMRGVQLFPLVFSRIAAGTFVLQVFESILTSSYSNADSNWVNICIESVIGVGSIVVMTLYAIYGSDSVCRDQFHPRYATKGSQLHNLAQSESEFYVRLGQHCANIDTFPVILNSIGRISWIARLADVPLLNLVQETVEQEMAACQQDSIQYHKLISGLNESNSLLKMSRARELQKGLAPGLDQLGKSSIAFAEDFGNAMSHVVSNPVISSGCLQVLVGVSCMLVAFDFCSIVDSERNRERMQRFWTEITWPSLSFIVVSLWDRMQFTWNPVLSAVRAEIAHLINHFSSDRFH